MYRRSGIIRHILQKITELFSNMNESEKLFAKYLRQHYLKYNLNFPVGPNERNIDFRVESNGQVVLCDVKEISDSIPARKDSIDAETHIREDIRRLRRKFGRNKPEEPCMLVSMNFSSNFFTGLTVVRAMLGEIGICFDKKTKQIITPIHHLPQGNAGMTKKQNTSISGIFVFDRFDESNHHLFTSPFAEHPVPTNFFPAVKTIEITKQSIDETLKELSSIMFWNMQITPSQT